MSRQRREMQRRVRDRADERVSRLFMARLAEGTDPVTPLPHPGAVLARMLGRPRRQLVRRSLLPIRLFEAFVAVFVLAAAGLILWSALGPESAAAQTAAMQTAAADNGGGTSVLVLGGLATIMVAALSSLISD